MSPTTDVPQQEKPTLEQELERLQAAEAGLERKTKDMWSAEVAALVVAFIALVLGAAALVAGISKSTSTTTVMMRSGAAGAANSSPATKTPAAANGMMGATSAPTGAAAARTINVRLGEMWVRPSRASIAAGKVTFVARNMGMLEHELMIERLPLEMDGPGRPSEGSAQGMIEAMDPMESGKMTVRLTPGAYELFCNLSGHYAAGQHTRFTVTKA